MSHPTKRSRIRRKKSTTPFYQDPCILARAIIVAVGLILILSAMAVT